MKKNSETPVLLIAFNRPDTTIKVMETLELVRPKKLYVAIDGPRSGRPEERILVEEVIKITKNISWECEAHYLIREYNVGCKNGVSGAISWVLEKEDRVIIIEDDIIAVPEFFNFAEELLERYKNDERIGMISANNYTPVSSSSDYLLTNYGHIWGWATWKRVWEKFDVAVPQIYNTLENNLSEMEFASNSEKRYFKKSFSKLATQLKNNSENTWDHQFGFFRLQNKLRSIVPRVNLASNIGENSSRDEQNNSKPLEHFYLSDKKFKLTNHPVSLKWNKAYDKHHFKNHIDKLSLLQKVKIKLNQIKN
ncbi:hypothetical protein JM84_1910 [Dokdonia sp. Hel_I_63]|uniref:hypothetical protein n=1 Tax=Dokdonia sp. Hel_I_63 TaxID=1249996 RepID=UPI00119C8C15|nr:hypothetical protein [Dokdonia sp. Hel_I_63]TVZ22994.1 hypothetical protein JM84_1910 [Dokdonia sp. Hel_I_63]